jgi:hypothetical protein
VLLLAGGVLMGSTSDSAGPAVSPGAALGGWFDDLPAKYVAQIGLATALLGAPLWVGLLLRRGHWQELLPGLLAGAMTGLVTGVTLACGVKVVDSLLHAIVPLTEPGMSLAAWALGGAALTLVSGLLGTPGRAIVAVLARPLSWLSDAIGLRRLSASLQEG